MTGLNALSTTSQPCAAATASSRVTASMASTLRGTAPERPGRTKPFTCQPASRKVSAATYPSRPAAPSTRMRPFIFSLSWGGALCRGRHLYRVGTGPFRMLGTRQGIHDVRFHVALPGPDRHWRGGGRVAARPSQYDARRLAQHLAKADAMARAAAVRRHHRDHGDDLDHARLAAATSKAPPAYIRPFHFSVWPSSSRLRCRYSARQ